MIGGLDAVVLLGGIVPVSTLFTLRTSPFSRKWFPGPPADPPPHRLLVPALIPEPATACRARPATFAPGLSSAVPLAGLPCKAPAGIPARWVRANRPVPVVALADRRVCLPAAEGRPGCDGWSVFFETGLAWPRLAGRSWEMRLAARATADPLWKGLCNAALGFALDAGGARVGQTRVVLDAVVAVVIAERPCVGFDFTFLGRGPTGKVPFLVSMTL